MDLYVSSVRGHVVGQLGTGTSTSKNAQIGARFNVELAEIVWDEDEVVVIPAESYAAHQRYYDKAIRNGSLKIRNEKDFAKWSEERAKRVVLEEQASKKARELELEEGKRAMAEEQKKEDEFQKGRRAMLEAARAKILEANKPKPAKKSKE